MSRLRRRRPDPANRPTSRSRTLGVCTAVALVAVSACGSDGDSADSEGSAVVAVDAVDAGTSDSTETDTPESTSDDAGASSDDGTDAGAAGATLTIETDTGESWSLAQDTCTYTPDAEGDIVELWGASADVPTGGGFFVSLFTTDPSQPALQQYSGALFDEARDVAYFVSNGDAVSDGTTMTMTLGMYATNEWDLGDPVDLIATVTCQL